MKTNHIVFQGLLPSGMPTLCLWRVFLSRLIFFLAITSSRDTFPVKQGDPSPSGSELPSVLSHSLCGPGFQEGLLWLVLVGGAVAESVGVWSSWELTGRLSSRGLCISRSVLVCGQFGSPHCMPASRQLACMQRGPGLESQGTQSSLLFGSLRSHARSLPLHCTHCAVVNVQPASRGGSTDSPFLMDGVALWGEYVIQETSSGPPLWDAVRRCYYCLLSSWHSHILKGIYPNCWRNMGLSVYFLWSEIKVFCLK